MPLFYPHVGRHSTSGLSDQQWETIRELLPLRKAGAGRPVTIDLRQAINGMLYIAKTGSQWENLPGEFPHYQSVYYHYRKWCLDGTWERVNLALVWLERRRQGRCPYPSAGIVDSQSVKTTRKGNERGYDAGKKVKGRKRHILVDTVGHLLKVMIHSASLQDRDGARLLLSTPNEGGFIRKCCAGKNGVDSHLLSVNDAKPAFTL